MAARCKADRRSGFRLDICRRGEAAYADCYRSWAGNGAGERERGTTDTARPLLKSKDARRIEARTTGPPGRDGFVRSDERLFARSQGRVLARVPSLKSTVWLQRRVSTRWVSLVCQTSLTTRRAPGTHRARSAASVAN